MQFSKLSFLALPAFGLVTMVTPMLGTSVTGGATISGNVTVSATTISFLPPTFTDAGSVATGAFSGLTSGVYNVPVLTGTLPVVDFMTFTTGVATPINFDLQGFLPPFGTLAGCSSNAVGSACTPAGSPFTLVQTAPAQVLVELAINGIAYTGTSASGSSPTQAIYTTQLTVPPDSCATITSCITLLAGGGSVTANYSANFSAGVPEPSTLLLMGAGLIGAGSFARRKLSKR
jgi:hypothetical protein